MIRSLGIRGLGVIDRAEVDLGPGLTVVTGETGAGKTMVVTALGLLLGQRADSQAVSSQAQRAIVGGVWDLSAPKTPGAAEVRERVDDLGGVIENDEVVLSRSIAREGRGRASVGGVAVPVATLAELGEQLVVVHGQSDQVRLRAPSAQLRALDRFAGAAAVAALNKYSAAFDSWRELTAKRAELELSVAERAVEARALRSDLELIESVGPEAAEDEVLAARLQKLEHAEALRAAAATAHAALTGGGEDTADVGNALSGAQRVLERAAEHDAELGSIAETLAEVNYGVADVVVRLAGYADSLEDGSERELAQAQSRFEALAGLNRRFGSIAEAIRIQEEGSDRLAELDATDDTLGALAAAVEEARSELVAAAGDLTAVRAEAAGRLSALVDQELAALAMPHARFQVKLASREPGSTGADEVEFTLSPHPGADPRPIAKGASGGELSRVMLALEVVIAATDPPPTFVFDEVDAGIGGAVAIEVGRRLARLARTTQVIAVTHLAQVAAFADQHLRVLKDASGEVTTSSVALLGGAERRVEMARLLSGLSDSEAALSHADELLALRASAS